MSIYSLLLEPFVNYGFMRRALIASIVLAVSAGPVGVLLVLRRMSLVGDAMSHAVLPGAAIGFLLAGGLSLPAMGAGGLIAGLLVAVFAGFVSRNTQLEEDASFAGFYVTALALGVLIVSLHGSSTDLLHVLFGSILAVDQVALLLVAAIASCTLLILAVIYRPLVMECFDPGFMRHMAAGGTLYYLLCLLLLVLNLVAGFQTLGTLMAIGMMLLPAIIARLWASSLPAMFLLAAVTGSVSAYVGLLLSYYFQFASGPCIILVASCIYLVSLCLAPTGLLRQWFPQSHFKVDGEPSA